MKDVTVKIELEGSNEEINTKTRYDGTTTNNEAKFEIGSKVTVTVTKGSLYFAKKRQYEFKDSNKDQLEYLIALDSAGKFNSSSG